MAGTVAIDQGLCLNFNYKKIECRRCRDVCPSGCIADGPEAGSDSCTGCGLCIAACPAEAVTVENYSRQGLEKLLADAEAPVHLACRRSSESSGWPCLGFLDGRLLLAFAYSRTGKNRQVAIDNTLCGECQPEVAAYLGQLILDVNQLLAAAGKELIIQGQGADTIRPEKQVVSRRAFFSRLMGATLDTVREVVTAGSGDGDRLPRHELFGRHVKSGQLADTGTRLFTNLAIGESCNACGFCRKICPHKAILVEDHGAELDFYHDPVSCTGCGVCAAHCPQSVLTLDTANSLEIYHIASRALPRCPVCSQVFQPVGNQTSCLECFFKNRDQLL